MVNPDKAILAFIELVSMIAFTIISLRLYRLYRLLKSINILRGAVCFSLLSMSQALMAFSVVSDNPRTAMALYASSSVLAAGGLYSLAAPHQGNYGFITVGGLKLGISVLDYVAGMLGLAASYNSRGVARIFLAVIGFSYMVRGASLIANMTGVMQGYVALLVLGEIVRATSAAVFSLFYASPGHGSGAEEED